MVGEMFVGLLVGMTVTDGDCDAFTERGTFPRDIDIASGKNDFWDDAFDEIDLFAKLTLFFDANDAELDGELVFVIVKLGVMFMLDWEFVRLAASKSA